MTDTPPQSGRARPVRRFALRGLVLLTLAFLAVSWVAVGQLQTLATQEAHARAHLVADNLAAQVQHAVQVGVPVDRLVGVQALFDHRLQAFDDLLAVSLRDSAGQTVHERRRATGKAPGISLGAPVVVNQVPVAHIDLEWRAPKTSTLLLAWALPLAALLGFTAALAAEALRHSLARQVLRRDRLVDTACARIGTGDFTFRAPRLGRREFDTRLPWLAGQLRHIGEQYRRVHHLASSLRRTEPDLDKRAQLDRILADALGSDHFAQTLSAHPDERQAQAALRRWRGLLLGLAAWSAMLAMGGTRMTPTWQLAIGAVLVLALCTLAARLRWWRPDAPGRMGALLGGALLGPGLCLLGLLVWAPRHFEALGPAGPALLALTSLGAMAVPWLRTPTATAPPAPGDTTKARDAA